MKHFRATTITEIMITMILSSILTISAYSMLKIVSDAGNSIMNMKMNVFEIPQDTTNGNMFILDSLWSDGHYRKMEELLIKEQTDERE